MAFELIPKGKIGIRLGDDEIRISNRQIRFGSGVAKRFKGFYGTEILIDNVKKAVAFKPSRNTAAAYSMGRKKLSICINNTRLFNYLKEFPRGSYKSKIINGMIVIELK